MTMTQHLLLALGWAILGSCVGSFLNVCAYRVPRGMSVLRPRSRCPRCGASIPARHNVPVLGWLTVRGRCHSCRGPISPRYPAVELAVGLLFAFPYLAAVALRPGDPFERLGAWRLLDLLLASWLLTGLATYLILVGCDSGWSFMARPEEGRHPGAAGAEGPASSAPRPRAVGG